MKKLIVILTALCLLLSGCASAQGGEAAALNGNESPAAAGEQETAAAVQPEASQRISPLPDNTMENLTDAILSVSLEEGDAYVDDKGRMQMELKIYTYDKYDMVDIARLQPGDVLVRHSGEVEVISKEQGETGTVYINGGLENGGFDLVTDDCGIFYEAGPNDAKSWYEIGEATIRVSADFRGVDNADPEQAGLVLYPGDFLIGAVTNYNFTPYNTTVRVADGQIVEMERVYIP